MKCVIQSTFIKARLGKCLKFSEWLTREKPNKRTDRWRPILSVNLVILQRSSSESQNMWWLFVSYITSTETYFWHVARKHFAQIARPGCLLACDKTWPKNMEETSAGPVAIWQLAHLLPPAELQLTWSALNSKDELNWGASIPACL